MRVRYKGAITVNHSALYPSGAIAAVCVDLKQKHAKVLAVGFNGETPCVMLCADDDTMHLNKRGDPAKPTEIEFPEFKGWMIFCAEISKYTLSICFVKPATIS